MAERDPDPETPPCHVCETPSGFFLVKDHYRLYRCPNCRLVFVSPQPGADYLATAVYSEAAGYHAREAREGWTLTPVQRRVLRELGAGRGRSLLDVGCSTGEFMHCARDHGFVVSGMELNSVTSGVARARGLSVCSGRLEEAGFDAAVFDVVVLGDVLEHVLNPKRLVTLCRHVLAPGGMLVVSTPNLACSWARGTYLLSRWLSIPWSAVTPPHHLFQFSVCNLDQLVHGCGFTRERMWFHRPPPLLYEIGSTHVLDRVKARTTLSNVAKATLVILLYATLYYGVDPMVSRLNGRDFSMVGMYRGG